MFKVLRIPLAALFLFGLVAETLAWSPNGFPVGQCTWYVDGRCNEVGWRLHFTVRTHARTWWDNIINHGGKGHAPRPGSIMVLDGWGANPHGHVAYVESVHGSDVHVTHANWSFGGTVVRHIQGRPIYHAWFRVYSGHVRQLVNGRPGNTAYPLRGFVYRP